MEKSASMNIAVVGSGVAGIVSAYLLQRKHQVTLFEKNDYVGGHTHTVVLKDGPDAGTPIDTGFIVHNDRTYPNFIKFINQLGVERVKCPMSFSYYDRNSGFTFASAAPFADPKNNFRPSYWKFLYDILRFNRLTLKYIKNNSFQDLSLGDFLNKNRFNQPFIRQYIIPMGAAIWSTPDDKMMNFPAETFARFFENHGLLSTTDQPQWYSIKGGSHEYVKAFLKVFSGKVSTNTPVRKIIRKNGYVAVQTDDAELSFDAVVLAAHADETFNMLADPSDEEIRLLSPWAYTANQTILHTDRNFLPPLAKARSSWNYLREQTTAEHMTMTYDMNMLHNLHTNNDYCVTLNPQSDISENMKISEFMYSHPQYTSESIATQEKLDSLNGQQNTWFCGSYFRYGFHEDAVLSGVNVAKGFGISL
ncbi:MAG: FAD-dependent oxidoreductase [Desulfobacteraceae bacterium]|jgi:predicted NAD/FAD-binding protein|nr:FAD-dependent oxidoreductase [Desulfobacteraceae bacterium]